MRGRVARTQIINASKRKILPPITSGPRIGAVRTRPKPSCQPPKKVIATRALTAIMPRYSAIMNWANFMPLYSVW